MLWLNHIRYSGRRFGDYFIEKTVGEGRYGTCFLAKNNYGSKVIIKRFKPNFIKKQGRNTLEAVILSQINHIAIPKLLGVINEKNFYAFVLEHKPGDTVESLLYKRKHRFTRDEIFKAVSQLINIISYLHDKGIIHGDIRPSNVLLDDGTVFLIDFGLSRRESFNHYTYGVDFSYLGDFLLYLLYSSYKPLKRNKAVWYNELDQSPEQMMFLKRLLRIKEPYNSIDEVKNDFDRAFGCE